MKKLIKQSIEIFNHPESKSIFNLHDTELPENATQEQINEINLNKAKNEMILNDFRFKKLDTLAGRNLRVWFKYEEDDIEKEGSLRLSIPKSDEPAIEKFILETINVYLNK